MVYRPRGRRQTPERMLLRMSNAACNAIVFTIVSLGVFTGSGHGWIADNGNGTFTNPLFYDEFSDPDMIRVGEDYYLTGTTMHSMPGLPILHCKDLVNREFIGYACDRLDLGPEFRLEEGREVYGQGIWAPSFRLRPPQGEWTGDTGRRRLVAGSGNRWPPSIFLPRRTVRIM